MDVDPAEYMSSSPSDTGESSSEGEGESSEYEVDDDPPPRFIHYVQGLQLSAGSGVHFPGDLGPREIHEVAQHLWQEQPIEEETRYVRFVKGVVEARDPSEAPGVGNRRETILEEFKDRVFRSKLPPELPPIRGPFGEAEINLKPGARPVKQRMFHITGERRDAWDKLTDEVIQSGKVEPGQGPWSSPSFPVPKKNPGEYRLVEDFRQVNTNTEDDAHPLPRIDEMVQRQAKYKIWSSLDCKDGYHQMPLKKEHRHITCMSTPKGTYQWRVQVMGLKNAGAQFQRMMEWVLREHECADPYIDDIIIGSTGETLEEAIENHERDLHAVLMTLAKYQIYVDPKKAHLFMQEVEFCGHVLREGRRSPAPGKLLAIQKWQEPQTITQLRGFLGLTNYYSNYVEGYAGMATPLMDMLKVSRVDGKKGSRKPLNWTAKAQAAFDGLKSALSRELELFQMDVDQPFTMRTDASDWAIGAVLEQEFQGKLRPVAFYSRKLGGSQLNWTPREKECYAIVCSLRKWAGWIGFQPVTILTDHRSLEEWAHENLDTPSGPRGRKARWHETLSQFKLEVRYVPGKDNVVADAMSRFAYPATSAREDVSFHGSAKAKEEVRAMAEKERQEERGQEPERDGTPAGQPMGDMAEGPEPERPVPKGPEPEGLKADHMVSQGHEPGDTETPAENNVTLTEEPEEPKVTEQPDSHETEMTKDYELDVEQELVYTHVVTRSGKVAQGEETPEVKPQEETGGAMGKAKDGNGDPGPPLRPSRATRPKGKRFQQSMTTDGVRQDRDRPEEARTSSGGGIPEEPENPDPASVSSPEHIVGGPHPTNPTDENLEGKESQWDVSLPSASTGVSEPTGHPGGKTKLPPLQATMSPREPQSLSSPPTAGNNPNEGELQNTEANENNPQPNLPGSTDQRDHTLPGVLTGDPEEVSRSQARQTGDQTEPIQVSPDPQESPTSRPYGAEPGSDRGTALPRGDSKASNTQVNHQGMTCHGGSSELTGQQERGRTQGGQTALGVPTTNDPQEPYYPLEPEGTSQRGQHPREPIPSNPWTAGENKHDLAKTKQEDAESRSAASEENASSRLSETPIPEDAILEGDMGDEWSLTPIAPTVRVRVPLTEEQWETALNHGLMSGPDGKVHGYDHMQSLPPWCEVIVWLDVPFMARDGIFIYHDASGDYFTHGSTLRGIIPTQYISHVEEVRTGLVIYSRNTEENMPEPSLQPDEEPLEVTQRPFQFQTDLPPEERAAYRRSQSTRPRASPYEQIRDTENMGESYIMDEDWSGAYLQSPCWRDAWHDIHDPDGEWPRGARLWDGKLYWTEKLCIPETLCLRIVAALHQTWGHVGIDKMIREVDRQCLFPTGMSSTQVVKQVKAACQVCQATEPPNWKVARKYDMTPVPDTIFASVSIDIFSLPEVEWLGQSYDAMVVCVDRLSGWIIAKPTQKEGLTSEKAAHLMLDDGWNIYGIPSVITSDQGPQFTGAWWRTLCQRLGVRQAFSQAHRPQANGRAEVAGKTLITILRKLNAEKEINWVEALPRALRIHHDMPNNSGLSPYRIVFGRDRALAGLPRQQGRQAEDAESFLDRMEEIDRQVKDAMEEVHLMQQRSANKSRTEGHEFRVGEKVWVARPKPLGGHKIQAWWVGPYPITERRGNQSYVVAWSPTETLRVHADQLKKWVPEEVEGLGVPLFYKQGVPPSQWPLSVYKVISHRETHKGLEFLTQWEGAPASMDTWVPIQDFVKNAPAAWREYCISNRLALSMG